MGTRKTRIIDKKTEELVETIPEDSKLRTVAAGGFGRMPSAEVVPTLVVPKNATLYQGQTNSAIIQSTNKKYGDRGSTGCGDMTLVCGFGPLDATPGMKVVPNNTSDNAKIYITAKGDPDADFGIKAGNIGKAKARSAVVVKADAVRLLSRDGGISIRTGMDTVNSQGGKVESITGIELVAGNRVEDIQPMVKGANLAAAMEKLTDHVDKLNGIVDHLLTTQMNFNESLTHHFHYSPWYGNSTTPSDAVVSKGIKTMVDFLQETKRSLVTHKANLVNFKQTYLMASGDRYINSRWNSVN